MTTIHKRTCHICEANCGVLVELDGRKVISIKGNPDNPLSRGHICPKATAIADLQDDPDRLRKPVKRVGDGWQEIEWDTAYREIAEKVVALDSEGARQSFYYGNPSAHDYGLSMQANILQRAVGVKQTFSASTLDQIPHHYAQYQLYGHVSLAAVPDIDRTMFLVLVGANPLASNGSLWTVPDVKKRIKALQERGGKLLVVDPRQTETAKIADKWLPVRPGTDTALFLGILQCILTKDHVLREGLAELVDDSWSKLKPMVDGFELEQLSSYCGIGVEEIREIAAQLTNGQPAAINARMGASVCEHGALNLWLVNLINLASGNLDREGGAMFPQPLLDFVGHAGRGSIRTIETARGTMPSVMNSIPMVAFADELMRDDDQRVRGLFVVAGNPVLSAPDGRRTQEGLDKLDLMVALDMQITETSRHAHYILPPCGPLEKDHYTFFFGPLSIRNFGSYSAPAFEIEEGQKADWEIAGELAAAILEAKGEPTPNLETPREKLDAMLQASPAGMTLAQVEAQEDGIDLGPLEPCLADRLVTKSGKIEVASDALAGGLQAFLRGAGVEPDRGSEPHRAPPCPLEQQLAAQFQAASERQGSLHIDDPPPRCRSARDRGWRHCARR